MYKISHWPECMSTVTGKYLTLRQVQSPHGNISPLNTTKFEFFTKHCLIFTYLWIAIHLYACVYCYIPNIPTVRGQLTYQLSAGKSTGNPGAENAQKHIETSEPWRGDKAFRTACATVLYFPLSSPFSTLPTANQNLTNTATTYFTETYGHRFTYLLLSLKMLQNVLITNIIHVVYSQRKTTLSNDIQSQSYATLCSSIYSAAQSLNWHRACSRKLKSLLKNGL